MNLQEDIQRIREVMNLNESPNKSVIDLINEKGLITAARFFGGYDTLVKLLDDYEIPKELLIKEIKDFMNDYTLISFSELGFDPIPYKENKDEYYEIVELGFNGVLIDVWGGYKFETLKGEYRVPYEELTYKTIVDIFEIISDVTASDFQ